MNYKPEEKDWMAYLYGELEGEEKQKMDEYILASDEAKQELKKFQELRSMLSAIEDKEVIAPPIFVDENKRRFFWSSPYMNTILGIAASLVLIILVGRFTGTQVSYSNSEFRLSFGTPEKTIEPVTQPVQNNLTPEQVQQMINASLASNNTSLQAGWQENQQHLEKSIRTNLANNSGKIDELVRQASLASQQQIRDYVAGIQTENMQLVKDYFQLTTSDQKKYLENLLVDFAGYLQQQRENDLQVVQTRLNSLEQNTDLFKQETEQILSSIITTVGAPPATTNGTRN